MVLGKKQTLAIRPFVENDRIIEPTRLDGRPRLDVYRVQRPQVVLGRGSRPKRELHSAACLADGVPVWRRRGGGGAVVLDTGVVLVGVAVQIDGPLRLQRWFERFSHWVIASLQAIEIDGVQRTGGSDLTIADSQGGLRKVGGACLYRSRDLVHYSTTLLVKAPFALMDKYLKHPPRAPAYRAGRAHRDFVSVLPTTRSAAEVEQALRPALKRNMTALLTALSVIRLGHDEHPQTAVDE
jgi:lipoate-protein ligase A